MASIRVDDHTHSEITHLLMMKIDLKGNKII